MPNLGLGPRRLAGATALAATLLATAVAGAPTSAAAGAGERGEQRSGEREIARVEVGKMSLNRKPGGRSILLVPVRYPIEVNGRAVRLRVTIDPRGAGRSVTRRLHTRVHGGALRRPERRRAFTFVHSLSLGPPLTARVEHGARVSVRADGSLDVEGDGEAELPAVDREARLLSLLPPSGPPLCASVPQLRVKPGKRVGLRLPSCSRGVRWRIQRAPRHGGARIVDGRLVYRAEPGFEGSDALRLRGIPVRFTVAAEGGLTVRALGDSVTAGFGYYDDGSSMTIASLLECRPAAKEFNDACSSNSALTESEPGEVEYAADYGLANNVSWAAQWANAHGITDYKNFAISGSEPKNWAPGGEFHSTTEQILDEDPDYVVLTMGANPLLSEMLFGIDNIGCAVSADILGGYRECVERAFREVSLRENLQKLYADLVENSSATILLMQYHLSVPSVALAYSATQIAEMGNLLNREIASVAAEVNPRRLRVVAPPHFSVGIDISPVYPSSYSCSRLGFLVDGQSVQSEPTQYELAILHPLSFCEGPPSGPPWVISGDTGIHPSAAGYAQMAAALPAPE